MKTYAQIGLLIFIYYIVYYTYSGLINPIPALGDSWDYHIPISESILNGSFFNPHNLRLPQQYYPGSSEAVNAVFLFLHIPLTISNILAIVVLSFVCFRLGLTFRLKYYTAVFFAVTVCTLNVFVRWYNAVSIDIWLTIFFLLGIILLEKPRKDVLYMSKLGFVLGMLIGSKYTGSLFFILLIIVYGKRLIKFITFKNLLAFIIPFSIFGLFWYVRNYILKQNPLYPLSIAGFQGVNIFSDTVWSQILQHPVDMINAVLGEYNIWLFAILFTLGLLIYSRSQKSYPKIFGINRLILTGVIGVFLYFTFPTSNQPWIMVSSLRYSYAAFIPLLLCTFLVAVYYKKELLLCFAALGNMLMVVSMTFYPKLTLIYIPLTLLVIYFIKKYEIIFDKKHKG